MYQFKPMPSPAAPLIAALRGLAFGVVALILMPQGADAQEQCRDDRVEIRSENGVSRFRVELAQTPQERATGLMHRDSMATGAGMFFIFQAPHSASFWMHDTLIPLDILFIDPTGRVNVIQTGQPLDDTSLPGGPNVQYVLEINGGLSDRMGIAPGDVLRHPALDPTLAAWPCAEAPADADDAAPAKE
ncbi:DUF192 domain-containing protein [Pseudooceanicola algae]|uniref:ACR n=1 Tax=Pseudooceanicola algae TaxID=1537215 RepID=A0A418SF48_9RHOB|nr:DUF192 domain-containing protein [Pseudooceanicola algae]QPM89832.1 hypothetical protein PSAL_010610 [Pseudooceanicola algae]